MGDGSDGSESAQRGYFCLNVGDTFQDIGLTEKPHLWIVVTTPDANGGVLILSVTTLQEWERDLTCVLKAGEHPFVTKESVISYQHARIRNVSLLEKMQEQGRHKPYPPASDGLVKRIRAGALNSDYMRNDGKALVRACPWPHLPTPPAEEEPA